MPLTNSSNSYGELPSFDFSIRAGVLEKYNGTSADVVIPNGVTIIGEKAFYECRGLRSVMIPSSVTEIGYWAFRGCRNLQKIVFPKSVSVIERRSFEDCTSLEYVDLPQNVSIEEDAFCNCKSLRKIVIPAGATIGYGAFKKSGLFSVEIRPNVTFNTRITFNPGYWTGPNSVTENIWDYSGGVDDHYDKGYICPFYGCASLSDIYCHTNCDPRVFFGSLWYKKYAEKKASEYKAQKRCQYCGGEFSGIFKKVCSNCRRSKDY